MKKLLVLLSVTFMILTSCSSDSSDNQNNSELVKKIISTSGSSTNTIQYTYNGNKLLSISYNNSQTIQYTYSGNLIINVKKYQPNNFLAGETIYTYDSSQRVSQERYIDYYSSYEETKIYTHNADNTVDFIVVDESLNLTGSTGVIYLNATGEVTKIEKFFQGNFASRYEVTNDNKNNPLKNITGYDKLPTTFNQMHNNLLTKYTNYLGVETSRSEFEYTYNADDYVNTFQQKLYNDGVLQSTTSVQYLYE
ncbi:MAG: hypothetical protein J0L86_00590 [Flavobacteriales bacterium]|nr:hypothetical protein [Flavobacteriales bacterium]